jgi:hypothetical protein
LGSGADTRDAHVRYFGDGAKVVVPTPRRLRRADPPMSKEIIMARSKKASELRAGDWFRDPIRTPNEGGQLRPAKVLKVYEIRYGRITFELDDDTKWRPWVASYPVDQKLELV